MPRPGLGVGCLALALITLLTASGLRAETPRDAAQELRQRLAETLEQQEQVRLAAQRLERDLKDLAAELEAGRARQAELAGQERETEALLRESGQRERELAPRLEADRARCLAGLRALYLHGPAVERALFASAADFHDALTRGQSLAWLVEARRRQWEAVREQTRRLAALQAQLAQRQAEIRAVRRQLAQQAERQEQLTNSQLQLKQDLAQRQAAMAENLAVLEEAQARLARTFALDPAPLRPDPAAGGVLGARGRLAAPVTGQVLGRGGGEGQGLLIQAAAGAPVRSPWAGTVVHAARLPGYGLVVVVDHGQRVHTVLAHLGGLGVEGGQAVAAGAVLGQVGDDGRLYLEVRREARPENPLDWLRLGP
ncbi:MAG: murein hydrolase activator EnvC family protein [Thermodesulfobacteriota bacterium]